MAARSSKTEAAPTDKDVEERSPEQIEAEIESTRDELGETVAELADKADVKKQAKKKVSETKAKATAKKEEVKEAASAKKQAVTGKVKEATPESGQGGTQQASQAAQQVTQAARENPVPAAAIGAFAGGLLIGWMLGHR